MKNLALLPLVFMLLSNTVSAESNSPYGWGFNKGKNGMAAEAGQKLDEMIKKYGAVYKGDSTKKDIYLTFDNGYENGYTGKVLDVLKKQHVPGAFFVTGHYLKTEPELVKRMAAEGHIVGNHSWHHPDMTGITTEKIRQELEMVREKTEELTGQKTMNYLRPPRGVFSERTMAVAKEEGYLHIFWSLAFKDWQIDQQKGAQYSYNEVMRQIHPGAILLLHTVSKDNADALDSIITDLKKQGYCFKTLDDLMIGQQLQERMLY
ncbi:delta-lactam-biosynthetic de-N-acetylase [Bacillus sp. CECT 9360]|uniref:delta-lactam-biosynthetic de-N-acetylase n=1 Tax=Bacillus sp. CECT 9360 TaxID=2845821 RepID=UPI001E600D86|nr:delta-lactam-biosynthetic de-N-acetylase [Bacillus sp. CECT 9360]CAH0345178.1 Peptidoglycan-N-acetylmuramic acid deacetylase PdaA [Bacillus sp. CECT 9360]